MAMTSTSAPPEVLLRALREPLAGTELVHLNNAGVSPMAAPARAALVELADVMARGSIGVPELLRRTEEARGAHAALVGCAPQDLAFFQTCAAAISQVAFGLTLRDGDELVLLDQEYPSNAYPWHRAAERAGARVVTVPSEQDLGIDPARVLEAITPRTRVVAVSWVQYSTGSVVPLRVLADAAHAVGAWLVVDAIQGLGVIPFDLTESGADAVCSGSHKWLLGPMGHGFLGLAPGRASALVPLMHGAMTYGTSEELFDPGRAPRAHGPQRFEPGTPAALGAVATGASAALLLELGIPRIHQEALVLADHLVSGARARGLEVRTSHERAGAPRSPIVTMVPRHLGPRDMERALRARGCSVAARGGGVRVAPHCHNGPQHIARFFELWDALDVPTN